jgi:hypothetical protein
MKKFPKPWYRSSRGVWYVTLGGMQHNLGPDRDKAFERYKRLLNQPMPPDGAATPSGEIPQPAIWEQCAAFLLKHGFRKEEILAELPLAGPTALAEAAILGLEHGNSPPTALFRRALLSPEASSWDRRIAAAALAVLDSPWSRDLLLSVLRESSSPEVTAESRAALRECRGPEGAAAADAWEENHPVPELESLPDPAGYVRLHMEELHDRVLPLRRRFA